MNTTQTKFETLTFEEFFESISTEGLKEYPSSLVKSMCLVMHSKGFNDGREFEVNWQKELLKFKL